MSKSIDDHEPRNFFEDFQEARAAINSEFFTPEGMQLSSQDANSPQFAAAQKSIALLAMGYSLIWFYQNNRKRQDFPSDLLALCEKGKTLKTQKLEELKSYSDALKSSIDDLLLLESINRPKTHKEGESWLFAIRDIFLSAIPDIQVKINYADDHQGIHLAVGESSRPKLSPLDQSAVLKAIADQFQSHMKETLELGEDFKSRMAHGFQAEPSLSRADKGPKSFIHGSSQLETMMRTIDFTVGDDKVFSTDTLAASPVGEDPGVTERRYQRAMNMEESERQSLQAQWGFLFPGTQSVPVRSCLIRLLTPSRLQTALGGNPDDRMVEQERAAHEAHNTSLSSEQQKVTYISCPLATQKAMGRREKGDVQEMASLFEPFIRAMSVKFGVPYVIGDQTLPANTEKHAENSPAEKSLLAKFAKVLKGDFRALTSKDIASLKKISANLIQQIDQCGVFDSSNSSEANTNNMKAGLLLRTVIELYESDQSLRQRFNQFDAWLSRCSSNKWAKRSLYAGAMYALGLGVAALSLGVAPAPLALLILSVSAFTSFVLAGGVRLIFKVLEGLYDLMFGDLDFHYPAYRSGLIAAAFGMTGRAVIGCKSARDRAGLLLKSEAVLLDQCLKDPDGRLDFKSSWSAEMMAHTNVTSFLSKTPLSRAIRSPAQEIEKRIFSKFSARLLLSAAPAFGLTVFLPAIPPLTVFLIGLSSCAVLFEGARQIASASVIGRKTGYALGLGLALLPIGAGVVAALMGALPAVGLTVLSGCSLLSFSIARCRAGNLAGGEQLSKELAPLSKPGKFSPERKKGAGDFRAAQSADEWMKDRVAQHNQDANATIQPQLSGSQAVASNSLTSDKGQHLQPSPHPPLFDRRGSSVNRSSRR